MMRRMGRLLLLLADLIGRNVWISDIFLMVVFPCFSQIKVFWGECFSKDKFFCFIFEITIKEIYHP